MSLYCISKMHFYETEEINIILPIKSKRQFVSQCSFLDAIICIYVYNLIIKTPMQGYRSHFIFTQLFFYLFLLFNGCV